MMRFAGALDAVKRAQKGAADAFGQGREDNRRAFMNAREDKGVEAEPTRIESMFGQNRTIGLIRQALGKADPYQLEAFRQMGMDLSSDRATRVGQVLGHLAADVTQDRSREVWWLLNAPQAVANVANEFAISRANPNIFNKLKDVDADSMGNKMLLDSPEAVERGLVDGKTGRLKKGYSVQDEEGEKVIKQRAFDPGHAAALGIPVGVAINSGIGLLNPFGGQEGYEAAIPDPEDRNKTSNVLAEVGSKYILGRSGNLLPWNEFKEQRPDVSKDEYMRYKAFKFDKKGDANIFDDGQVTLPSGVLKYNNDGIHGAEVQFLGRSLPLATAILPAATAIAGTALGVRRGKPITGGFLGGMAGLTGGMVTGNTIEAERRRRNAAANELDNIDEEEIQLKS
jgi:hypothetical protein